MSTRLKLSALLAALVVSFQMSPSTAHADQYQLVSRDDGTTGITMQIPYSAGIHDGQAQSAGGIVQFDPQTQTVTGQFLVPVDSMTTGNSKRDCHMREGLTLDYTKSKFPGSHVCGNDDKIPADQTISFPNIEFDVLSIAPASGPLTLTPGKTANVTVQGRWIIHGITKPATAPATITTLADGRIEVKFTQNLLLSDFNITVKPFLFITVKGNAIVKLDLILKKK